MKTYKGTRFHNRYPETRDSTKVTVTVSENASDGISLAELRHYFPKMASYDCPLDWGKGQMGFGGTNLSASILADHFDSWNSGTLEPIPVELIRGFLIAVISKLPYETWELSSDEIQEFIDEYVEAEVEAMERFVESCEDAEEGLSTMLVGFPEPSHMFDRDEYRGADS